MKTVGFRHQEAFGLAQDERPTDEAGCPAEAVEVKGVAHSRGYGPKLDKLVDGCGYRAFAPNGRMCPSVILPTRTLSQEQVQRLLKTSQLPKSGQILRCGHQYHHSFVFFDRDKLPVGEVAFGFSCGRWSRNDGEMMPEGASDVLAELCRELGLPGCPGDEVLDASREALVELRSGPLPRPSEMFDIDPSTSIAELSVQQRAELCAWRALEESRPGAGLEFRSGRTITFQTFDECVENFPSCNSALGEVEQTDFSFAPPAMHLRSSAKCVEEWAFGEHRKCLWGMTMRE